MILDNVTNSFTISFIVIISNLFSFLVLLLNLIHKFTYVIVLSLVNKLDLIKKIQNIDR
jgi:hypothetical protein